LSRSSWRTKERDQPLDSIGADLQVAFPHNDHAPPGAPQLCLRSCVSFLVSTEFCLPEDRSRFWNVSLAASVPMPKAPMNEDDSSSAGKHKIGLSR